ncbi:MAG: hypothetical protein JOZ41_01560 [Chloroflexi bacterium]|nr:hypothetical protein [Chloroflexota bacterium]
MVLSSRYYGHSPLFLQQVINSLSVATLSAILTVRTTVHVDAVKATLAHTAHQSVTPVPPVAAAHAAQALHAAVTAALANAFDDTSLVVVVLGVRCWPRWPPFPTRSPGS